MKIATKIWTTHDVGTKVEAFAIAGCDTVSKYVPLCPCELIYTLCRSFHDVQEEGGLPEGRNSEQNQ